MSQVIDIAKTLIAKASITPDDAGCQLWIADFLKKLDFNITHLPDHDVNNLWAVRGTGSPLFVFLGHTDVVPPGPLADWTHPPFEPTIHDDKLYGRGAADMKGAVAAMLVAVENFIKENPNHAGSIGLMLTSDEEGQAEYGVKSMMRYLDQQNIHIHYCLVGEASSEKQVGDSIKIGRRGSLSGKLSIKGKQGHIAYPQYAENPIHRSTQALQQLCTTQWDQGNEHFPPTSFQMSNIHAGTGANNIIPGELVIDFNFRYSPAVTADQLQQRVIETLDQANLSYQIDWRLSGLPFFTDPQHKFIQTIQRAIKTSQQIETQLSTSGGTSDGRFVAPTGSAVVELGVCNATIHQIDECCHLTDLQNLADVYQVILKNIL